MLNMGWLKLIPERKFFLSIWKHFLGFFLSKKTVGDILHKKQREIEKLRGPNYKSKGDLREYANLLREKSSTYKKVKT